MKDVLTFKNFIKSRRNLPRKNMKNGDAYLIIEEGCYLVWVNNKWEKLGNEININDYLKEKKDDKQRSNKNN